MTVSIYYVQNDYYSVNTYRYIMYKGGFKLKSIFLSLQFYFISQS